ncbi:MAG: hypothetical protein ACRDM1_13825 [Gaiellaceae bacterium]
MKYVWLAIIGLSLVPVAVAAFLANPLVFMVLGAEAWRLRVTRLYPYRWWFGFSILVCGFATAVFSIRYG